MATRNKAPGDLVRAERRLTNFLLGIFFLGTKLYTKNEQAISRNVHQMELFGHPGHVHPVQRRSLGVRVAFHVQNVKRRVSIVNMHLENGQP
jgi:hypothetical protein